MLHQLKFDHLVISKTQSMGEIGSSEIGSIFKQQLENLNKKINSKKQEQVEITENDSDDDSDDFLEELDEAGGKSIANNEITDPSKLIDLELINLLKYCHQLESQRETDDYQEDLMMKSFELGKKTKPKTLIFDMDETLVAAKFEGRVPEKFVTNFSFPFADTTISVRLRPYLVDCLEKLATMYEILIFTAGQQEYADQILDYIDQDNKIFKQRLYRQDCI